MNRNEATVNFYRATDGAFNNSEYLKMIAASKGLSNAAISLISTPCALLSEGFDLLSSISNILFAKKLLKFIYHCNEIPLEKRMNFVSDHVDANEIEFVETMMMVIDKCDSFDKCKPLANLFRAQQIGFIDRSTLLLLCSVVNHSFLPDLIYLASRRGKEFACGVSGFQLSLLGVAFGNTLGSMCVEKVIEENTAYTISPLGHQLIQYGLYCGDECAL